jgi:hypothetical protein
MSKYGKSLLEGAEGASHVLVTYADNWSDEMDIDGHCVMTAEEFKEFIERH